MPVVPAGFFPFRLITLLMIVLLLVDHRRIPRTLLFRHVLTPSGTFRRGYVLSVVKDPAHLVMYAGSILLGVWEGVAEGL